MYIQLTEVAVDLNLLMTILLSLAGVVALVALTVLLVRAGKLVSRLNDMLAGSQKPLEESVKALPPILEQVGTIAQNVSDLTDDLTDTVPEILDQVSSITENVSDVVDSSAGLVTQLTDGLTSLLNKLAKSVKGGGSIVRVLGRVGKWTLRRAGKKSGEKIKDMMGSRAERREQRRKERKARR